ncbi:hypothetical protein JCM12141A_46860 [Mycolicibacterium hodleri]
MLTVMMPPPTDKAPPATVKAMSGPTPAEIIEAFRARASRVITSELVDATQAQLRAGYSFQVSVVT